MRALKRLVEAFKILPLASLHMRAGKVHILFTNLIPVSPLRVASAYSVVFPFRRWRADSSVVVQYHSR